MKPSSGKPPKKIGKPLSLLYDTIDVSSLLRNGTSLKGYFRRENGSKTPVHYWTTIISRFRTGRRKEEKKLHYFKEKYIYHWSMISFIYSEHRASCGSVKERMPFRFRIAENFMSSPRNTKCATSLGDRSTSTSRAKPDLPKNGRKFNNTTRRWTYPRCVSVCRKQPRFLNTPRTIPEGTPLARATCWFQPSQPGNSSHLTTYNSRLFVYTFIRRLKRILTPSITITP